MKTRRTHRYGFTLIEILLALSLLAVFTLMAFRLLDADIKLSEETLAADSNTARFDRALRMLRADLAGADSVGSEGTDSLRLRLVGDQTVDWKTTNNAMSRCIGDDTTRWAVGQRLHLRLDGSIVLLSVSPTDEIAIASAPKGASR